MKILIMICGLLAGWEASAQLKIGRIVKETAERTVDNKVSQKTSETVDKGIDEGISRTIKGVKKVFKQRKKGGGGEDSGEGVGGGAGDGGSMEPGIDTTVQPGFGAYTNFTFVPGSETLFFDDFTSDAVGDFPVAWETGGSGEVVNTNIYTGQWLSLQRRSGYLPVTGGELPENYTIEFDLATNGYAKGNAPSKIFLRFLPKKAYSGGAAGSRAELEIAMNDKFTIAQVSNFGSEAPTRINTAIQRSFEKAHNGIVHLSIAVNKQRLRVWLDEEKVVDAPSILPGKLGRWFLLEVLDVLPEKGHFAGITNFRIAKADQDLRSLFNQQGRYSTTGIYFNVDEAFILPQSFAVIKSVADMLKANPALQLTIVGHTDNTGTDERNRELSLHRANAVKEALVTEFSIDGGRLQAEGKGAAEPVADNGNARGKAKNRRVEFIKR